VDETHVGGEEPGHPGRPGRDSEKKVPVAVALELDDEGKPRRVAIASVKRVDGHCLKRFATKMIAKGSKPRTDGWGAYPVVADPGRSANNKRLWRRLRDRYEEGASHSQWRD